MEIREIRPADIDAVLSLNESSMPHVGDMDAAKLDWFLANAGFCRVVDEQDRIAAFIIGLRPGTGYASPNYRWFCDRYDDFAYVDRVAVAEWAWRRGIGEHLYDEFALSQPGAPAITCEVNIRPPNEPSMRFHKHLGFHQVGTLESADGDKKVAMLAKPL